MLLWLFEIKKHTGIGNLLSIKDCFRKIEHPEIRRFVKECPFWIFFPLILINSIKNYFGWGGFDLQLPFYISQVYFCLTKVAFYWRKEPFSKKNLVELFHFKYFLIFLCFFVWNIFITYFPYMFSDMRYNDTHAKHVNIGCENKKLNWYVMF